MPRQTSPSWVPKYRFHRSSGHAYVALAGKNHFLGKHGTPASREKYDALVAEWLTRNRRPEPGLALAGSSGGITVTELIAAYRRYAEGAYPRSTVAVIKAAVRPLRALYGHLHVGEFTPPRLKTLQRTMAEGSGLCRNTVNDYLARVRGMAKWGVSEGLMPATVWQALLSVPGLRRGRTKARETDPVGPVPDANVEATLPHLPRVIADMVRVQRLTGMRPGEVCAMTTGELDTTGAVWMFSPRHHKTEHHGKSRTVAIGPRAQAILKGYLRPELDRRLFRPCDSEAERKARLHEARKTPLTPSQRARAEAAAARQARRGRPPGEKYTPPSYRRAVERAAARAGVPEWSPNQLRHARATEVRREHGLDTAGAVLGHAKLETTQIYAERSLGLAIEAARQTG